MCVSVLFSLRHITVAFLQETASGFLFLLLRVLNSNQGTSKREMFLLIGSRSLSLAGI